MNYQDPWHKPNVRYIYVSPIWRDCASGHSQILLWGEHKVPGSHQDKNSCQRVLVGSSSCHGTGQMVLTPRFASSWGSLTFLQRCDACLVCQHSQAKLWVPEFLVHSFWWWKTWRKYLEDAMADMLLVCKGPSHTQLPGLKQQLGTQCPFLPKVLLQHL